ncbi:unnamed protein product [Lactuca saligna]|uniref:Uncharacterized protein n=1 Tax=Lactuca saligna TaxID=75948 RepID=A0AA35YVQ0_LACSI|nr:unnamed protein product [Lactuca saligna]
MASALSKADGIDYTDPEELLVATIMDLDAMDGKGSVSLLAKCSTSPNNTIKFFFNPKTTAKVHVLGSTYQNQLLKMIDVGCSSICLGDCPPDAILPHEECNKANKIAYYSELHKVLRWANGTRDHEVGKNVRPMKKKKKTQWDLQSGL